MLMNSLNFLPISLMFCMAITILFTLFFLNSPMTVEFMAGSLESFSAYLFESFGFYQRLQFYIML